MRVFIAGPYTKGDVAQNVALAMGMADYLIMNGHAPYTPHLTHFQHLYTARPYEVWTKLDMAFLEVCEAVIRLPGESPGADAEVKRAKELGIPVYSNPEDIPK